VKFDSQADKLIEAFGAHSDLLRAALENTPAGVVVVDLECRIIFYNDAQAKFDGNKPSEVIGRLESEVMTPISESSFFTEECHKTGEPILGYIFRYKTFKGRRNCAFCRVYPLFINKKIAGSICFNYAMECVSRSANVSPAPLSPIDDRSNFSQASLIGGNYLFQKALLMAKGSANNPLPVLVTGETGSGKELFAKLIHQSSPRSDKPFLAMNCAAIPGSLLEGILFGTVKGSFTGAIDRPGLFEEANGGTIYLDEIDSMPVELQPKLLRVLQDMKIRRIGSAKPIRLNIKLVSSINNSPQHAISSGKLRPDLFYRLAVVIIELPPLRDRLDDLEALCDHFMQKYSEVLGKKVLRIDEQLWSLMCLYNWPGNIRELEHMLAGAVTAMPRQESTLSFEHVPNHYVQAFASCSMSGLSYQKNVQSKDNKRPLLVERGRLAKSSKVEELLASGDIEEKRAEMLNILHCLKQTGGNISKAAQMLNMSRQVLTYRLMKLGLSRKDFK